MDSSSKKRKAGPGPDAAASNSEEDDFDDNRQQVQIGSATRATVTEFDDSLAVVRLSGSPKDPQECGKKTVGHYRLAKLVSHPETGQEIGYKKTKCQPMTLVLIHSTPLVDALGHASLQLVTCGEGGTSRAGSVGSGDTVGDARRPLEQVPGDLRVEGSATVANDLTVGGALRHEGALVSGGSMAPQQGSRARMGQPRGRGNSITL